MQSILATVAVSTFLMLALGPSQLQGLPGHLRTHDGVMAENEEMERAVVEALLAMARSQDDKTTANEQQHENQMATNEQYPQQTSNKNAQQQNKTALMQQIWSKMMKTQLTSARNQRIQNRRLQSARSQYWPGPYAQQRPYAQQWPLAGEESALAQQSPSGITIQYCGAAGNIIQNALRFGLGFIPGGDKAYGVYIACAEQPTYPCTTVTVAVPAGDIKADIDVCDYGNNGDVCVEVYGGSCSPGFLAIPLTINVPVGSKQVQVTVKVDTFGKCASVEVYAPKC